MPKPSSTAATDGYLDLQLNGYLGVDFRRPDLPLEDLHRVCRGLQAHGIAGVLATVTTDAIDAMVAALRRLVALREQDPLIRQMIWGLHIEGPFLSPVDGFRGAHPLTAIRSADVDGMKRLLDAAGGLARLVTLAPEMDPGFKVTQYLGRQGLRISAGHTDATLDQLRASIDAGLSMFTHLGNGCPMQLPRHDNIIQRALSLSDRLWPMFIADGAHIPFFALRNYLRAAGLDRTIVVTDGMTASGMGPGRYRIGLWDVQIGPDMVARAPDGSHLIGSAMTMPDAHRRLIEQVGLTAAEARQLTCQNPRRALGL